MKFEYLKNENGKWQYRLIGVDGKPTSEPRTEFPTMKAVREAIKKITDKLSNFEIKTARVKE